MKKETVLRVALPIAAVMASIGIGFAGVSSAQTATPTAGTSTLAGQTRQMQGMAGRPGVMGKVTAISGSTLTVAGTNPKDSTVTTYTVDATNAKVMKGSASAAPVASTVSAIVVGDTVAVRGTVTGTNVVATEVMDGAMMGHGFGGKGGPGMGAMGTVTAVNGTTVTITGKDGKSYTIDGSAAKVSKTTTITVGQIQVGDTIGVRGTVSGTSVAAEDIMDGIPQAPQGAGVPNATQ